jgi:hypothetical protein
MGLGSRKNLFRIPDPGVKKAPDPGSGSATLPETNVQPKERERNPLPATLPEPDNVMIWGP